MADAMPSQLPIFAVTSIITGIMSEKKELKYAFASNLLVPMTLGQKLKRVLFNNWTKMRRLRSCCGNYGQPGC